jgi:quercetin dioxygenase-like cupin family protein
MTFWTCRETAASAAHTHDCEYMLVVEGRYTLIIRGERIPLEAGSEYLIPRSTPHSGEVATDTPPSIASAGAESSGRLPYSYTKK